MRSRHALVRTLLVLGLSLGLGAACGEASGEAEGMCAEGPAPECAPLYAPTFDNLYSRRLAAGCATASVCHAGDGSGGLGWRTADEAYAALVDDGRVMPGAPTCGELMDRLTATSAARQMPPGEPLSSAELCTIRQWIAAGAPR
jgi:hypothetical protein